MSTTDFPSEDIDLVVSQTRVPRKVAIHSLFVKRGDIVNAIMYIDDELTRIYVTRVTLLATECLHYVVFYFYDGGVCEDVILSDKEIVQFLSLHPSVKLDETGCGMDHFMQNDGVVEEKFQVRKKQKTDP